MKLRTSKDIILSRALYFILGFLFFVGLFSANAAWNSKVSSGIQLTSALWNDLVDKIIELDGKIINLDNGNLNYQQRNCVNITYSASGNVMCPAGKYAAGVWDDGGGMPGMNGIVCCN